MRNLVFKLSLGFMVILSALLALLLIERVSLFINRINMEQIPTYIYSKDHRRELDRYDELLGFKPKENTEVRVRKMMNDVILYDAVYSIDGYGRRKTPVTNASSRKTPVTNASSRKTPILFFGGSFTFGAAVQDNQTMPYFIGTMLPGHMPYNYGFNGHGPNQMLARLQDSGIRKEVQGSSAILIYTFLDFHINRSVGSYSVVANYGKNMPYYDYDNKGHLVRKGSFLSGKPILTKLCLMMRKTELGKFIFRKMDFPPFSRKHAKLTADIIKESCAIFKDKFNSNNFYVVVYPGSVKWKTIEPYLQNTEIKVLDYSSLYESFNDYEIPNDHHPDHMAYKLLSKLIVRDLGLR
ncbi:MAG: hypothetical protein JW803_07740 [Endomicrobiales bacterium]|nr:hypothetical protein [Endomicrobiales bacterium]